MLMKDKFEELKGTLTDGELLELTELLCTWFQRDKALRLHQELQESDEALDEMAVALRIAEAKIEAHEEFEKTVKEAREDLQHELRKAEED